MGKKYNGNNGISVKLIVSKIEKELNKEMPTLPRKERKVKKTSKIRTLSTSDRKHLSMGLQILERIVFKGFDIEEQKLLSGKTDVSKLRKEIFGYRKLMETFIRKLSMDARDMYKLQQRIELLSDYSEIAQAARDGIILKPETRTETINGEPREIIYDTSMTPKEVLSILKEYQSKREKLEFNRLSNYLGLGLGLAGTLGAMFSETKTNGKKMTSLIALGTTALSGLKLLQGVKDTDTSKKFDLINQMINMEDDFLEIEHISNKSKEDDLKNIEQVSYESQKLSNKIENKELSLNMIADLAIALITGIYTNSTTEIQENGKIDGKSLSSSLISLTNAGTNINSFANTIRHISIDKTENEDFEEICIKVRKILDQMEEKVYPLKGATHPFDSLEISNFTGNFYPKKDYNTGEVNYCSTIKIPEFSMKRGDVVLLSGESGSGKSTFLRFLKRGDINNRKAIKLDNNERVDSLGNEYISFRPSIELGDETNVLYQITGKSSISNLSEEEQFNLLSILNELKFSSPNLLNELASRKFMEFSTGQQKRLALSKLFYRIDDGTSVIIVDEPVGNVEDSLIKEQLEMIKNYAMSKNVMLLLTTHRLDLAEEFATKRYNINNSGVLEQLPIKNKKLEEEFCAEI